MLKTEKPGFYRKMWKPGTFFIFSFCNHTGSFSLIAYVLLMSHSLNNAAHTLNINVLVVPQHFGGGVTDQGQFVFVCALYVLHHGCKSVAGAVGGVLAAAYSVHFRQWVCNAASFQNVVEPLAVILNGHTAAVGVAEHRAGNLVGGEPVNDWLDFRADGNDPVFTGFGLCTALEGALLAVIIGNVQGKQLGGAETKMALGNHIICIWDDADVRPDGSQGFHGQTFFSHALCTIDHQILSHVQASEVTGDGILIEQTNDGFHVLLSALSGYFVHALLQIVHGDLADGEIPDGHKLLHSGSVAVHGGLALFVGWFPLVPDLQEGGLVCLFYPGFRSKFCQVGNGFLLGLKAGLGNGFLVLLLLYIGMITNHPNGNPCAVCKLINGAGAVAPALGILGQILLCSAGVAKLCTVYQLSTAFSTLHIT